MASLHAPVSRPVRRSRLWAPLAAAAALLLLGIGLAGCESAERTTSMAETGPPPDGYETWEDYYKATDADYEKFEQDVEVHRMNRPRVPGAP
jgi:hypothetical protein